jgi:hypothetical protein
MKVTINQKYRRILLLLSIITLGAISFTGCATTITSFQGGIRVEAQEGIVSTGGVALFAMPAVPNRGRLLVRRSNLSTGTLSTFMGATNATGISDYPTAITDAQWSVGVGPSTAPPCLANAFVEEVPLQGGHFVYFCYI